MGRKSKHEGICVYILLIHCCMVETNNTVEQLSSTNRNFQKEYLCPHKILNMNAYNSFAYDCLNLEATKMFFKRGMNKEIVVHPCNGILFRD